MFCKKPMAARHDFGKYRLLYCSRCHLGRLHPFPSPEELANLYSSEDYFAGDSQHGYADYQGDAPQFLRTFRSKVQRLLKHGPVERLLEVGCGTGFFLDTARSMGIERLTGVDPNPWAVAQARARTLDVRLGSLEALDHDEHFDAAVMLDVIEHITDPVPFLARLRQHLNPGGRLLIMTPNIRSLLALSSGRRWVSFKIPEHVYYYSPRSIRSLLERAGYDVLSTRATGQYVTVPFFLDRLSRIAPGASRVLGRVAHGLRLDDRVVFVSNGSIDVVARRR